MRSLGPALPKLRVVAAAAAFATLYFLVAELTTRLVGDPGIAVLWPASGVYLGVMLVAPRRLWAALAVGAGLGSLAAYASAGGSLETSLAFAVPSSAEGLLAAVLIERIVRGRFSLGGLHDVSALAVGSVTAMALVAISAGAVAAQTFDVSFVESWLRWWSADAVGVLAVAPLVVALAHGGRRRPSGDELRFAAGVVVVVAVAVVSEPSGTAAMVGGALALPLLLWAGWRWGPRAAALGGAGVALAAIHLASGSDLLGTSSGSGVHVVQAFLAALLLSSLAFAAAVADWRRERTAAARSSRRLRAMADSSPDAYVTVDADGVITGWSASAHAMFGMSSERAVGRSLETIAPGAGPVTPTPDARELTLLARHGTGREFPAALTVRPGIDGEDGLWHVFVRDLTESERLGRELGRATEELRRRGSDRDEARAELRGTSRELERAGRRIEELAGDVDARDRELAAARRELAELRAARRELEATRAELADARRAADTLRRDQAAATSARDKAREETGRTAREADRLRADLARATAELSRLRTDLSTTAGDLARATATNRQLEERTQAARAAHERMAEELEAARAGEARMADGLDAARGEHARMAEELDAARAGEARMAESLDSARAEQARLADEVEVARGERARSAAEVASALAARQRAEDELERVAEALREADAEREAVDARRRTQDAERSLLAEHSAELISRYDERGICLYASPGARGLLGYDPAELVGRQGAELVHPEDRARLLRARAGQAETTFEIRLRHRNGEYVETEVSFRPAAGAAGRLGEVTTVARPARAAQSGPAAHDGRAADDAGRVAETRFRSLFGTLPYPSALVGQDGRIRRANLAFSQLTGYSRDQLEGAALGTLVDEDGAAVFSGRLRQVATGQVPTLRTEQRLAHAAGRTIAVALRVTPLPGDTGDARVHDLVVHFQELSEATRPSGAASPSSARAA